VARPRSDYRAGCCGAWLPGSHSKAQCHRMGRPGPTQASASQCPRSLCIDAQSLSSCCLPPFCMAEGSWMGSSSEVFASFCFSERRASDWYDWWQNEATSSWEATSEGLRSVIASDEIASSCLTSGRPCQSRCCQSWSAEFSFWAAHYLLWPCRCFGQTSAHSSSRCSSLSCGHSSPHPCGHCRCFSAHCSSLSQH